MVSPFCHPFAIGLSTGGVRGKWKFPVNVDPFGLWFDSSNSHENFFPTITTLYVLPGSVVGLCLPTNALQPAMLSCVQEGEGSEEEEKAILAELQMLQARRLLRTLAVIQDIADALLTLPDLGGESSFSFLSLSDSFFLYTCVH